MDPPPLTLAQLLADLDTLRNTADPSAALALVSARPSTTTTTDPNVPVVTENAADDDADLQRAKDLVSLHYKVKVAYSAGEFSRDLENARVAVRSVVPL